MFHFLTLYFISSSFFYLPVVVTWLSRKLYLQTDQIDFFGTFSPSFNIYAIVFKSSEQVPRILFDNYVNLVCSLGFPQNTTPRQKSSLTCFWRAAQKQREVFVLLLTQQRCRPHGKQPMAHSPTCWSWL